ncbi:MAG: Flp family type IVb pilin [Desulfitobacteriaceae bacterium]
MSKLVRLFKEEEGQGMTEYAMIIGCVVVLVVAAWAIFGPKITDVFTDAGTALDSAR